MIVGPEQLLLEHRGGELALDCGLASHQQEFLPERVLSPQVIDPLSLLRGDFQLREEDSFDRSDLLAVVLGQVAKVYHEHVPQVLQGNHFFAFALWLFLAYLLFKSLHESTFSRSMDASSVFLVPECLIAFMLSFHGLRLLHQQFLHFFFFEVDHLVDLVLGDCIAGLQHRLHLNQDHLQSLLLRVFLHQVLSRLLLVQLDLLYQVSILLF